MKFSISGEIPQMATALCFLGTLLSLSGDCHYFLLFFFFCISLAILFYTSLLGKDVWSLLLPAEDLVGAVCIIIFVTL